MWYLQACCGPRFTNINHIHVYIDPKSRFFSRRESSYCETTKVFFQGMSKLAHHVIRNGQKMQLNVSKRHFGKISTFGRPVTPEDINLHFKTFIAVSFQILGWLT